MTLYFTKQAFLTSSRFASMFGQFEKKNGKNTHNCQIVIYKNSERNLQTIMWLSTRKLESNIPYQVKLRFNHA